MKEKELYKQRVQPKVVASRIEDIKRRETFLKGVKANPLMFYCPNGANEKLIKLFAGCTENTDVPVINCTYANGVGKTFSIFNIVGNIILKPQNAWFDYPVFWNWKYNKEIWYCSEPENLIDNMPILVEMLKIQSENIKYEEVEDVTSEKLGKTYISEIVKNDFKIRAFSYGQEPKKIEGKQPGMIINDEPAPEPFYKSEKSRRRMGCIIINIMTPLEVEPYVIDEYEKSHKDGRNTHFHLTASLYEACQERGIRGHLDPKIIDDMVEDYDEDEREARVYGKFMYFSSHIYPNFSVATHLVDLTENGFIVGGKEYEIPKGSILKMANDPKDGRPDAVVWGWVFPNGRKLIVGEYPFDKKRHYWEMKNPVPISKMVKEWWEEETYQGWNVSRRIMDRVFGWQTRDETFLNLHYINEGKKLAAEVGDPKINFTFVKSYEMKGEQRSLHYRHKVVQEHLEIQPDGLPNLLFARNCYHAVEGMKHYIRKKSTDKRSRDMATADAKVIDKYKDFPDAVAFLVCDGMIPRTKPERKYIKRDDNRDSAYNIFSTF